MKYTNYFSIDYTFQFLSVDFENDLFKIHLLSSSNDNNLMVMSMLLKDLLVHEQRVAHANAIPDFQLLPTNILEKIIPKQLLLQPLRPVFYWAPISIFLKKIVFKKKKISLPRVPIAPR
jgi:hypothetical protein